MGQNQFAKYVDVFHFLNDGLAIPFPQEEGQYLWFIADLHTLELGSVQVLEDSEKHKAYLRGLSDNVRGAYIYKTKDGKELTMYHQDPFHLPSLAEDGKPMVDGYVKFEHTVINDRMHDWGKWKYRFESEVKE